MEELAAAWRWPTPLLLPATHSRGEGGGGKGPVPVRVSWDGPGPQSGTHLRPVAAAASLVIGGMCVAWRRVGSVWMLRGRRSSTWCSPFLLDSVTTLMGWRDMVPTRNPAKNHWGHHSSHSWALVQKKGDLEINRASGKRESRAALAPKRTPPDGGPTLPAQPRARAPFCFHLFRVPVLKTGGKKS